MWYVAIHVVREDIYKQHVLNSRAEVWSPMSLKTLEHYMTITNQIRMTRVT